MENSQVRVDLVIGSASLSFAGTEGLFREAVPDLCDRVLSTPVAPAEPHPQSVATVEGAERLHAEIDIVGVCQALNVHSGPDLIKAACAKLSVVDGKRSFSYNEIYREVSGAHGYVTDSHKHNLKRNIHNLVKRHELIQEKKDTFALSPDQQSEYGRQLRRP